MSDDPDFAFNPVQGWDVKNPPKQEDKPYDYTNPGREALIQRQYGPRSKQIRDGKWPSK